MDNLIPILYLKGISSGDMSEALESILGPGAAGLSATNIVRLKALWEQDYETWRKRDFELKHCAYFWVDGIHFNVRLDEERSCILVVMRANESGRKELLAVSDGHAESKASWREILLDLKRRGLQTGPKLAVADGALGSGRRFEKSTQDVGSNVAWYITPAFGLCRLSSQSHVGCWIRTAIRLVGSA